MITHAIIFFIKNSNNFKVFWKYHLSSCFSRFSMRFSCYSFNILWLILLKSFIFIDSEKFIKQMFKTYLKDLKKYTLLRTV